MGALHSEILSRHLSKRVLQAMMDPDSPPWLFETKLADLVETKGKKTPKNKNPPPIEDAQPAPGNDPENQPGNMLDKLKLMLANRTGDPAKQ